MKRIISMLIALVGLVAMAADPVGAQERLVLVTPANTVDTVISEVITRKAYARIGIKVTIKKFPGERALRLANSGKVDGEVQRINGIASTYHNLVQVHPAINFIEGAVFTRTEKFTVKGWNSLKPYRIGYIRGIKFAEQNTRNMNSSAVSDYKIMFNMLKKNRFQLIISPRLNGLFQMKQLGIEDVYELKPAIKKFDLFHYLHQKHVKLAPKISAVFTDMASKGELAEIRNRVVAVMLDRASRNLPVCDNDYACFD